MNKKNRFFLFICILIFSAGIYFFQNESVNTFKDDEMHVSNEENVKVHFIDVGQGDSILIQSREAVILIDGGDNKTKEDLQGYLKKAGVTRIDYCIATHPHSDHIGGLAEVIENFDVKKVMMPKVVHTTDTFERLVDAIAKKDLKITEPKSGDTFSFGKLSFKILAPNSETYKDLNNYSIVLKMEWGETNFLFTGDSEALSENEILEKKYNIKSDVLKVAHHGSSTSTTEEFLKMVNPKVAVISCGKDNSYGHPTEEIIERLNEQGIKTFRVDELGTVVLTSDGKQIFMDGKAVSN